MVNKKYTCKGEIIINTVIILGRLTKDPDLKFTANKGTAVTRFTLAVTRPFKKDETDFINCLAFGKTAETISTYLLKGRQVAIEGSIRTGSYEANDGSKRYTTDVVVNSFEFISGGKGKQGEESSEGLDEFDEDMTPVVDGEMPF